MTLDKLEVGKDAVIESVGGKGALRRHFLDMGLTPGTEVTMMKKAPMGDPIELRLRSTANTLFFFFIIFYLKFQIMPSRKRMARSSLCHLSFVLPPRKTCRIRRFTSCGFHEETAKLIAFTGY